VLCVSDTTHSGLPYQYLETRLTRETTTHEAQGLSARPADPDGRAQPTQSSRLPDLLEEARQRRAVGIVRGERLLEALRVDAVLVVLETFDAERALRCAAGVAALKPQKAEELASVG
jgi:hypothetical protein